MSHFYEKLNKNYKYLLAVSGGPDSMFLLDNFYKAKFKIFVAHVNYQKRIDSDEDELIVVNYCKKNKISYKVLKVNEKEYDSKKNFQDQARKIRLNFFHQIAKENQINFLVLAHHFKDHLETYLLQKQRNSIVEYYGLPYIRKIKNLTILRPMLDITKEEIYQYLNSKNIKFQEDITNNLDIYKRNVIRKKINLMSSVKIKEITKEINDINKCLINEEKKVKNMLVKVIFNGRIKCKSFLFLEEKWQKKVLYQYLKNIDSCLITENYLKRILNILIKSKKPNIIYKLNNEWIFIKEYEWFFIISSKSIKKDNYCFTIKKLKNFQCPYLSLKLNNDNSSKAIGFYVIEKDFPIYITCNNGQEKIKTLLGTKKINRLFIENKIGLLDRINWPVIYNKDMQLISIAMLAIDINYLKQKNNWFMVK